MTAEVKCQGPECAFIALTDMTWGLYPHPCPWVWGLRFSSVPDLQSLAGLCCRCTCLLLCSALPVPGTME